MAKSKYWDIRPIKKIPALYRLVIGERSNGKTYGVDLDCIEDYVKTGAQTAYVRRWPDDIRQRKMQQKFEAIVRNGEIRRLTEDRWNGVAYKNGQFFLMATDGEDKVYDEKPFAFTFSISAMEHDKSIPYPGVKRIVFDEFISRISYIPDEFSLFMNLISSIVRERDDVDIWMLANTVSKDCPYFREMGLRHVTKQEPGTIDTYAFKKNGQEMLVAVEYTKNITSKASDKYFIFDNPKLEMITGGAWEMAIYPHLFEKYKPRQVMYKFYITYRDINLQCEIVEGKNGIFIYTHIKTSELKYKEDDLVYDTTPTSRKMTKMSIMIAESKLEQRIGELIRTDRICFQDNEVGEVFNDYLKWCRSKQTIRR